jgi:hypothetical protein
MDWGYYCRTCGTSSDSVCHELDSLWTAYREVQSDLESLESTDTITTDTLDVRSLMFLARHSRHDLWAECETGVLRLSPSSEPYRGSALPERFLRCQR